MTIEVPLPDLTALPAWAYVTGGVWVWYLLAAVVVRVMQWAGVFKRHAERANSLDFVPFFLGYDGAYLYTSREEWHRVLARRTAAAAWITSPVLLPLLMVVTALWSSAHVASLGLVPRPWSRSTVA